VNVNGAPVVGGLADLAVCDLSLAEAAQRHGAAWRGLLQDLRLNVSLSPEFLAASSASVGLASQMRVRVATRHGALVGALPYFIKPTRMYAIPLRMVCLGGNLIAYHHEIVQRDCALELLRSLLAHGGLGWDVFYADSLPVDGATAAALRALCAEIGGALVAYPGDAAPYLPITQTWDDFLKSKSSNFRYNLKRKEKALTKGCDLTERWFNGPDDVEDLLHCMQQIEASSWKKLADVAVTSKQNELAYYREMVPFLAANGHLFANVLYLDGEAVAYHLCYRFGGVVGNMKTSFKEERGALSPGAVVIQRAIRRAFEEGATEFDFLGDAQYHKALWTDLVRRHEATFLFAPTLRGRIVGGLKKQVQRWRRTEFHHVIRRSDVTGPGQDRRDAA